MELVLIHDNRITINKHTSWVGIIAHTRYNKRLAKANEYDHSGLRVQTNLIPLSP